MPEASLHVPKWALTVSRGRRLVIVSRDQQARHQQNRNIYSPLYT